MTEIEDSLLPLIIDYLAITPGQKTDINSLINQLKETLSMEGKNVNNVEEMFHYCVSVGSDMGLLRKDSTNSILRLKFAPNSKTAEILSKRLNFHDTNYPADENPETNGFDSPRTDPVTENDNDFYNQDCIDDEEEIDESSNMGDLEIDFNETDTDQDIADEDEDEDEGEINENIENNDDNQPETEPSTEREVNMETVQDDEPAQAQAQAQNRSVDSIPESASHVDDTGLCRYKGKRRLRSVNPYPDF